jgi:hypothetical protein
MSRSTVNLVFDTVAAAAKESSGFDRGRVTAEPTPGRWQVETDEGATIVLSVAGDVFEPTIGQRVDISKVHGIRAIEGPSA